MAISVLDVRETFAPTHVRVPSRGSDAAPAPVTRRLPVTVLGCGLIGILEAVGILAVGISNLDSVLSAVRPAGWVLGAGLLVLAGWIVLCAGSAAALIDGAGRRLVMGVAYGELTLVAMFLAVAVALPLPTPAGLPLPALGLLLLAVPTGKLLLVGSPSAGGWIAQGPRMRVRRADPVQAHRMLATVTLGLIGLTLGAVAILTPVDGRSAQDPASVVFTQP